MQVQGNFNSLSVIAPRDGLDGFVEKVPSCIKDLNATHEHVESYKSVEGKCSAVVLPQYPYRICDVTEAFASTLGFKLADLKNASLRLTFGPKTDLKRLQTLLSGQTRSEEEVWLYRKDGDEMGCSICSITSSLPNGDLVSTITILNRDSEHKSVRSAQNQDFEVRALKMPSPVQPACSMLLDNETPLSRDPALLAHLRAILRSRKALAGNCAL